MLFHFAVFVFSWIKQRKKEQTKSSSHFILQFFPQIIDNSKNHKQCWLAVVRMSDKQTQFQNKSSMLQWKEFWMWNSLFIFSPKAFSKRISTQNHYRSLIEICSWTKLEFFIWGTQKKQCAINRKTEWSIKTAFQQSLIL